MREALRVKSKKYASQVSTSRSYAAPIGGWNTRDSLASMSPIEAIVLENWYPKTSYVEGRGGTSSHATGMTGTGKTLATYNAMSGTSYMYCTTESGVYDVSASGVVGASKAARTNGKHQWVNFGDGTNNYLILVNGVDKPLYYDGTNWTAVDGATSPALTGITTTELINVFTSKGRLYFIAKNSLSFWYLAAGAAGGLLTEFDLSAYAKRGGYLVAGSTWTRDGGDGPDDDVVFVTSEGEVIIYRGNNPSSSSFWSLVGIYDIGKPLGRRCLVKYGGDLVILTERGALPMTAVMGKKEEQSKFALSFKIEPTFTNAGSVYGSTFGWTSVFYPEQSALIVNVPIAEDGEHEQYVMNTITKAWCKFKEWDAEDFVVFGGDLYYTSGTSVTKAWTGSSDLSANIIYYGKTSFSYFDRPGIQKKFVLFRPVLAVNGSISFLTDLDVDFNDTEITGTATYTVSSGAVFDTSLWDSSYWAAGMAVTKEWTSPDEWAGYCASGKLKISNDSLTIQWISNDYVYQTGGIM